MKSSNSVFIALTIPLEVREELTAIAYHLGHKGRVASAARYLIMEGIKRYVNGLTVPRRAQYNQILANVKIESQFNPPKPPRKSPYRYIKKKLRGGV